MDLAPTVTLKPRTPRVSKGSEDRQAGHVPLSRRTRVLYAAVGMALSSFSLSMLILLLDAV